MSSQRCFQAKVISANLTEYFGRAWEETQEISNLNSLEPVILHDHDQDSEFAIPNSLYMYY